MTVWDSQNQDLPTAITRELIVCLNGRQEDFMSKIKQIEKQTKWNKTQNFSTKCWKQKLWQGNKL